MGKMVDISQDKPSRPNPHAQSDSRWKLTQGSASVGP